jgi:hypothetical protein
MAFNVLSMAKRIRELKRKEKVRQNVSQLYRVIHLKTPAVRKTLCFTSEDDMAKKTDGYV